MCPLHNFACKDIFEKDKLTSLIEAVHPALYGKDAPTSMTSLCKELLSSHTKECSKEITQGLKWKKTNQTNKNSMKFIRKEQAIQDGFEAVTAM